jgi:hypothetical protein
MGLADPRRTGASESAVHYNQDMPHCKCLVMIPNPRGGNEHYPIVAGTSREAAQKAMESHPYPVLVDDVITVIADGQEPADPGASEHNARQPTF